MEPSHDPLHCCYLSRPRQARIVIATDWKASTGEASAENQDKLKWVADHIPMLLAGTISRAIELQAAYRQFFDSLSKRTPPITANRNNIGDLIRKPAAIFKAKLSNEHVSLKLGLSYKDFREAVGKGEIPESVATDTYAEIKSIDLDCEIILPFSWVRMPIFSVSGPTDASKSVTTSLQSAVVLL